MLFARHFALEKRLWLAAFFVALSVILVLLGFDKPVASALQSAGWAGAVAAGAFYTFGMTTPFAMAVILDLMRAAQNPLGVLLLASAAAATVDEILFSLVRGTLEKNTRALASKLRTRKGKRKLGFQVAGFFVFGLPLPDEIALALMGITRIEPARLWAVVFLAKAATLWLLWTAL